MVCMCVCVCVCFPKNGTMALLSHHSVYAEIHCFLFFSIVDQMSCTIDVPLHTHMLIDPKGKTVCVLFVYVIERERERERCFHKCDATCEYIEHLHVSI